MPQRGNDVGEHYLLIMPKHDPKLISQTLCRINESIAKLQLLLRRCRVNYRAIAILTKTRLLCQEIILPFILFDQAKTDAHSHESTDYTDFYLLDRYYIS